MLTKKDKHIREAAEKWVQDESITKNTYEVDRAFRAGAKYILDKINQANSANTKTELTLPIQNVSNLLNADNALTFNEWLTKYFEPAKISRIYKDKIKGLEYTERFLYKKYARAYKLSI